MSTRVLLIQCPDRKGLIHAITGVLFRHGLNIVSNGEFVDEESQTFFMRTEVDGELDELPICAELLGQLPGGASVRFLPPEPAPVVVLVSREYHCLGDLLIRHAHGDLKAAILAIVGNHDTLEPLAARFGIPFHHVSHENLSRAEHEARLLEVLEGFAPDYVVLAKYMRVLGPAFLQRYPNRIVNIHHSFLPAFVGPLPYQQAWRRGVKIIGATAHFVTENLDDGPIIAQSVTPVDHSETAGNMAQAGRDVEKIVLSHALKLLFEGRVFLSGNRTVVL